MAAGAYVERAVTVPGVVFWRRTEPRSGAARPARILPDGCLDDVAVVLDALARYRLDRATDSARPGAIRPDPGLARLVALLREGHRVGEAADALGLAARQLHRRSLVAFGYGPKTLARILRLTRALDLVRSGRPVARVAAETGFADQPHLAREVRQLTGVPLGELVPVPIRGLPTAGSPTPGLPAPGAQARDATGQPSGA